jgi:7-keto-8-aminopelargonate synthetase-like enzyme
MLIKLSLVTKLGLRCTEVFINPVIPPACAPQDTLVRFALMATHTEEQVESGVQALKKIFVDEGIIK